MATQTNDSIQNNSPKPLDQKLSKWDGSTASTYSSVSEANSTVLEAYRSVGLTVIVTDEVGNTQEYWWRNGVEDEDLVVKLDYLSDGERSAAIGFIKNISAYKDSLALGHGSYVGTRLPVVSWNSGTMQLGITATSYSAEDKTAIISLNDNAFTLLDITSVTNGSPTTLLTLGTNPFVGSFGLASNYFIVKLVVDNNKKGSLAGGIASVAEGIGAIALGVGAYAKGDSSVALGSGKALAANSTAMGADTTASGTYSTAMGEGSTASGSDGSTAMGYFAVANGSKGDMASGFRAQTTGPYCSAFGKDTLASRPAESVHGIGRYFEGNYNTPGGMAQKADNHLSIQTTSATQTNLVLDGITLTGGDAFALRGEVVRYKGTIIGKEVTVDGTGGTTYAVFTIDGVYTKIGGTGALAVNNVTSIINASTYGTPVVAIDNTNLYVKVTGKAATTINWYCHLETVELVSVFNNH